jgi:enoyl-CoA hydratase
VVENDSKHAISEGSRPETDQAIRIESRRCAGTIVLDRPRALNAVNRSMRLAMMEAFPRFARDPLIYGVILRSAVPGVFSAGGDIREMTALSTTDPAEACAAFFEELRLCWLQDCFSKPTIALIDGPVMGTGVGISLYGTHRVAGAGYRFSMPETAIGFFPDCGTSYPFAKMPNAIGIYLALTGRAVGPADAFALGLVTHCIAASDFDVIAAQIEDADPVDPVLDALHRDPGPSALVADGARIARYFEKPSMAAIMDGLRDAPASDRAWADEILSEFSRRAPLSLAITLEAVRRARVFDLRGALHQDYRIAARMLMAPDFREGVRAFLIDKSRDPVWSPATLADVGPDLVASIFASTGPDEPSLPTRAEMQSARV